MQMSPRTGLSVGAHLSWRVKPNAWFGAGRRLPHFSPLLFSRGWWHWWGWSIRPLLFQYTPSREARSGPPASTSCPLCASVEISQADDESWNAKRQPERFLPSALCSVVFALRTRRCLCCVSVSPCSAGARARWKTVNGGRQPPPPSCHIFFPFGVFWWGGQIWGKMLIRRVKEEGGSWPAQCCPPAAKTHTCRPLTLPSPSPVPHPSDSQWSCRCLELDMYGRPQMPKLKRPKEITN